MALFLKDNSFVNRLLFPAPTPTYTPNSMGTDLIWIPDSSEHPEFSSLSNSSSSSRSSFSCGGLKLHRSRSRRQSLQELSANSQQHSASHKSPCLLLRRPQAEFLVIFFHGNGEDLGGSRDFLKDLMDVLFPTCCLSILAPEYPGYGCHDGQANETGVLKVARDAYSFARFCLNFPPENIWVFGVSIGSGPAVYLSANYDVGGLILLAAFESIRAVVRHLVGKPACYLIANRFANKELISKVLCPAVFIHGSQDRLIPCAHSKQLFNACASEQKQLIIAEGVGHNEFDLLEDIAAPIESLIQHIRDVRKQLAIEVEVPAILGATLIDLDCLEPPLDQARRLQHRDKPSPWRRLSNLLKSDRSRREGYEDHQVSDQASDNREYNSLRSREIEEYIAMLVSMGYCWAVAEEAMAMSRGNFEMALEILLAQQHELFPM